MASQVYLGIGSNLNSENALLFAIANIKNILSDLTLSPVYESKAIREAEPDYLNMVVGGITELTFEELYAQLSKIELMAGKELMHHNSTNFGLKRRLDIDILIFDDLVRNEPCKVPRHDIQDYPYVTFPLNDIAPNLVHPILKMKVSELYEQMVPYIPENRKVHKVDFDFNKQAPNWQEE